MKVNHFPRQILFSVALLITVTAKAQTKTAAVVAPPEIKLVPSPSRVVIFHDFDTNEPQVARDKKDELISECTDSLLSVLAKTITNLLPSLECIIVPASDSDSLKTPASFLHKYKADLAFGIVDFRPEVVRGEVTTTENDDKSKSKSAAYSMMASGALRIYNGDSLIKNFTFSESQFLQDRAVVSGLLAAGPSR
jgi:hypothetical protein